MVRKSRAALICIKDASVMGGFLLFTQQIVSCHWVKGLEVDQDQLNHGQTHQAPAWRERNHQLHFLKRNWILFKVKE